MAKVEENMLRSLVILGCLGTTTVANAGEQLFTGRVEKIVLRPSGSPGCPPPCPVSTPNADGTTRVCVSNMGGCQSTEIAVQDVILGDARPGATMTVESRTGEWGGTTFPESHNLILVSLEGRSHRWTAIRERDGKLFLHPDRFPYIGRVPVTSLPLDEQGMVSLDQFLARLHSSQASR
jgi:hypothetical protein